MGLVLLVCGASISSATLEAHKATPIEKVVELLKKLSADISAEGKVEAAEYDKFACFCKEQADEKLYAIETSTKKIALAKAKEDELKKSIGELSQEVSDLSTKIGNLETDIQKATDKREGEYETYTKQAKDLNDAISACERAIEAMEDSKDSIDGKVDLAQLSASSPLLASALLAQASKQAPASFQYSSNEILATLEGLLEKFKENKVELDETEFNAKAAFDLKKQDMSNQKSFAEKEKFEKEEQSESLSETLQIPQRERSKRPSQRRPMTNS
jgi:septal ring factor EnvC (AmiA/AmiB activator)